MPSAAEASSSTSLRPVTVPPTTNQVQISALKRKVAALQDQVKAYQALESKLATITDEPKWDAMIPFGPLAYFKGQLIHTNDITHVESSSTPSSSALVPTVTAAGVPSATQAGASSPPTRTLKSAKQAREAAAKGRQGVEQLLRDLDEQVRKQQDEAGKAKSIYPGLEDGWVVGEDGQVMNEDGLPIFDIQEELPAEAVAAEKTVKEEPAAPKAEAPKMRYLIKKGGKQIVRSLNVPSATSPEIQSSPASNHEPSPVDASEIKRKQEMDALFERLEKEEAEEAEVAAKKAAIEDAEEETKAVEAETISDAGEDDDDDEDEDEPKPPPPQPTPAPPLRNVTVSAPNTPTPLPKPKPTPSTTKPEPSSTKPAKPEPFLSGFGAGFLSKGKGKAKSVSTPLAAKPSPPIAERLPTTLPTTPLVSKSGTSDEAEVREPLHHYLPNPKPIWKPTPPSSAASSRPASPRSDRKVSFDVVESEPKSVKPKRAPIILPPPPSDTSAPASQEAPKSAASKDPFVRPIKENVVERPVRPPSAPKLRAAVSSAVKEKDQSIKTLGRPPRTAQPIAVPSNPPAASFTAPPRAPTYNGPTHTLAFSSKPNPEKPLIPGEASVHELRDSDDEEANPSMTSDGDTDSDSSGFYGNEDLTDEEELDIDSALHAREVALEYHRQRMSVGAGAGTGPLGGDSLPEAFDPWNQPNVPLDASVGGRVPGTAAQSRFRTGRLESASMIIPSLLESQLRQDDGHESEEEDGISPEEREHIRISLEKLMTGQELPPPLPKPEGVKVGGARASSSISQMLGVNPADDFPARPTAPPVVRSVGTPIAVPSNKSLARDDSGPAPPALVTASGEGAPKKTSRFKARQLGLE